MDEDNSPLTVGTTNNFLKVPSNKNGHIADHSNENEDKIIRSHYESMKADQQGSLNKTLALAAFGISMGLSLPHGFNTGVLNPQEHYIKEMLNKSYSARTSDDYVTATVIDFLWSMSVSIYLVGGVIGAFTFGTLADKLGRKKSAYVFIAVSFVGAVFYGFCQLANSFEMLLVARFTVGYGCGAGSGLSPLFLTEIAPVNIRGAMGVLHQLQLTIGIMLSQLIGLSFILGRQELWPLLCALSALPGLLALFILPCQPDSPRYLLVQRGDADATEKALRHFRQCKDTGPLMLELRMDLRRKQLEPPWSFRRTLAHKAFRWPLILVTGTNLAQQLSGINVAFYYSRGVLESAGIPSSSVQYAVLAIGAINVLMTCISVALVEKCGRRLLLLLSIAGMLFCGSLLTLCLNLLSVAGVFSYGALISMVMFVVSFALGLGCIPQFLGSELFTTGPRPAAMALAAAANWFGNWVVGLFFPFLARFLGNWCFLPFLVCLALFFVLIFLRLPESKGKSAEEMAALFGVTDFHKVDSQASDMMELIETDLATSRNTLVSSTSLNVNRNMRVV